MAVNPATGGLALEAILATLGLASLVLFGVALGLFLAYKYTLGQALDTIANALDAVRISVGRFHSPRVLRPVARRIRALNTKIYHLLAWLVAITERGTVYFFEAMAKVFNWMARETAQLAKTLFKTGENIIRGVLPRFRRALIAYLRPIMRALAHAALRPLSALYRTLWRRVLALAKLWRRFGLFVLAALRRFLPRVMRLLLRAMSPLVRALRKLLARFMRLVFGRLHALAHLLRSLARRFPSLRQLLRYLSRGLPWRPFLRLFLRALAKLDLGWLRARNVIAAGKWLMRQSWDVIDGLLAFVSVVEGQLSLDEFAHLMIEAEDEIVELTRHTWDVAA